jgi:hypothetical protein
LKSIFPFLLLIIIVLFSMVGCTHHYVGNFPKRLEIVSNDGNAMELNMNDLAEDGKEYYVNMSVNGKTLEDDKLIIDTSKMIFPISETGKHTFTFSTKEGANKTKNKIWEQDVFVLKEDPDGLSEETINKLARKYAPFVLLDGKEEYLPASIPYLQNWDDDTKKSIDECDVDVDLKIPGIEKFSFPYNDLAKVLPYNAHNEAILDTIGISLFKFYARKTKRDALKGRRGEPDNIIIYYSYIPNPEKKQQIAINYHFLYTYDPKMEAENDKKKFSHVFDRESMSVVFSWDKNKPVGIPDNPEVSGNTLNPRPEYIIYGAHVSGQTIYLIDDESIPQETKDGKGKFKPEDQDKLQEWTAPRIKVNWEDVVKIEHHPTVAVARGSHALYPIPGWYYVKQTRLLEPAMGEKAIIPSNIALSNTMQEEFRETSTYELEDLELGSITSASWNRVLSFSGYLVDIVIMKGARFPPFTEREVDINKWINGDIPVWDSTKISDKSEQKMNRLMNYR